MPAKSSVIDIRDALLAPRRDVAVGIAVKS
jgi:hypothetical protein